MPDIEGQRTIVGNADSDDFQSYNLEVGPGASPSVFQPLAGSLLKLLGPVPRPAGTWPVRRLNGLHTLRMLINGQEINRSGVTVGQEIPITGGLARDQAGRFFVGVPGGTFTETNFLTVTELRVPEETALPPVFPAPDNRLQPLTGPYEILPQLPPSAFSKGVDLTLSYGSLLSGIDLVGGQEAAPTQPPVVGGAASVNQTDTPELRQAWVERNLGWYSWDGTTLTRMPGNRLRRDPLNKTVTLTGVRDFQKEYVVLPVNSPPGIPQFFALPFIFSPTSTTPSRQSTTITTGIQTVTRA